jgi:hypothetical protein
MPDEDRGNSFHNILVIGVRPAGNSAGTEALKRTVCLKLGAPAGCWAKLSS